MCKKKLKHYKINGAQIKPFNAGKHTTCCRIFELRLAVYEINQPDKIP